MWFKYFITFLDILMCLCILFFAKANTNKSSTIGFALMFLSYLGSLILIWR